jgi:hypothetical protein
MRQTEQGRRTATRNSLTKDRSSGGDDNSDDDDDLNASLPVRCRGPKPNSPADDSPAARVETHDEKIDQVQIPVGTKLARSLRDLEWKAAVATFSGITMIKNTLGYNNDEAEVVYPQFSSGKGDMTPDLPSSYCRVSLNDDIEATRRKKKAKHPTVEDSTLHPPRNHRELRRHPPSPLYYLSHFDLCRHLLVLRQKEPYHQTST